MAPRPHRRSRRARDNGGRARDYGGRGSSNASYEENRLRTMTPSSGLDVDLSALDISEGGSESQTSSTSSSAARQKTYLKWSQTPSIEIIAGHQQSSFKLPGDFITCRSRRFDIMMTSESEEPDPRIIHLPETSSDTFEHILVWLMSPRPSLDFGLSMSVAVDIAIFATTYQLPSLLNQTLDILWRHFSSSKSFWSPDLLDRIYHNTTVDDLLRQFTRASLLYIKRPGDNWFEETFSVEDWHIAFENNPTLGFDYFIMKQKGCTTEDFVSKGSCYFHQHVFQGLEINSFGPSICKQFEEAECFEDVNDRDPRSWLQDVAHDLGATKGSPGSLEQPISSYTVVPIPESRTLELPMARKSCRPTCQVRTQDQ